jgi:hypothetical protein
MKEENPCFIQPTERITTKSRTSTSWVISVIVSIKKFHALFSTEGIISLF